MHVLLLVTITTNGNNVTLPLTSSERQKITWAAHRTHKKHADTTTDPLIRPVPFGPNLVPPARTFKEKLLVWLGSTAWETCILQNTRFFLQQFLQQYCCKFRMMLSCSFAYFRGFSNLYVGTSTYLCPGLRNRNRSRPPT